MSSRKFGPRTKEERKRRSKTSVDKNNSNSNEREILPEEAADAKAERRRQLQDELRAKQGQMSSKKKKRLDKYVENKLKKDEAREYIKKLEDSYVDTSAFQSSKNFGRKKFRNLAHDQKGEAVTDGNDSTSNTSDSESETEPEVKSVIRPIEGISKSQVISQAVASTAVSLGSGLKRPIEKDATGAPMVRKRQRLSRPPRFGVRETDELEASLNQTSESGLEDLADSDAESSSDTSWSGFSDEIDPVKAETSQRTQLYHLKKPAIDTSFGAIDTDKDQEETKGDGPKEDSSDGSEDEDEDEDDDKDDEDEEAENLAASMFAALAQARRSSQATNDVQIPRRDVSGFKEWATKQLNEARDFVPNRALDDLRSSTDTAAQLKMAVKFTPRPPEEDPLPTELQIPNKPMDRTVHAVFVNRVPEVQTARLKLPVVAEEQKIMEAIHNNPVTVVCGATGSGKTTQVPQFLFEAGYGDPSGPTPGMIAVTQPRRVAAVTMAKRVAQELGDAGHKVAYQIRYGNTVSRETAVKFMTDGILIREIASDFKLTKYSAIVIDEAHERSVNTDILIGMLSRIVELREDNHKQDPERNRPLKLIVMSATLMAEAFLNNPKLFRRKTPPLVTSEGRQYPVTMHFARQTRGDHVEEAFKKIMRGHKKLRPGAMLVFLTGENEILALSKKLHEALGKRVYQSGPKVSIAALDAPLESEDFETSNVIRNQYREDMAEDESSEEDEDAGSEDGSEDEEDLAQPGDENDERSDALILPLYSKLPTKEQLRVFEPPPKNTRLIVLATNVAETSITIPDVRYVFDCGKSKEKTYDTSTGVQSFEVGWISKASATQRAGRAGRTGPGHCYRLYSSALFESDFKDNTLPEILRTPIEGVVLQLKSMDLQHVANFPFPTPPDQRQIMKAEKLLSYLGALDSSGKATALGRELSVYPISPRYAKMLAEGRRWDCTLLTVAAVAALATPELLIGEAQLDLANESQLALSDASHDERKKLYHRVQAKFASRDKLSDAVKLVSAFGAYATEIARETSGGSADDFCRKWFIRSKAARESHLLFQQLVHIIADDKLELAGNGMLRVPPPSQGQIATLKKIVAAGFIDQVAIRADLLPSPPTSLPKPKRAIEVPYKTLFPSRDGSASSKEEDRFVYTYPASVLAQRSVAEMPQYLVYSHLQQGSRVRMHPLTPVTENDLFVMAQGTPLLEYSKPIGRVMSVPGEPNKRDCLVTPSLVGPRGTTGWPLREQKVRQKKIKGIWEVVEVAL